MRFFMKVMRHMVLRYLVETATDNHVRTVANVKAISIKAVAHWAIAAALLSSLRKWVCSN